MKTYICTCGTSIISKSGINIDRLKHRPIFDMNELDADIEATRDRVLDSLERLSLPRDINDTSAEIKSLIKMGVQSDDRVILISSDTIDGKLSAELVKDFLHYSKVLASSQVEIKTISGLQALDGSNFQKAGLKNLLSYLVELEHNNIILNPTGGYKSVVPYISLIGMLFNKPVQYIHEDSEDVLTLTNLPVMLNDNIMFKIEDKIRKIEKETAISKEEWQSGIDYHDHRLDCFVDDIDGSITISGVGFLFWERFKQDYPEDLLRDDRLVIEKFNKLRDQGVGHHGASRLLQLSEKFLQSPYVQSIPNSCNNQPKAKHWITALKSEEAKQHLQRSSESICMVTDIRSDAGYSFLLETTARNYDENLRIAEILRRKYFD